MGEWRLTILYFRNHRRGSPRRSDVTSQSKSAFIFVCFAPRLYWGRGWGTGRDANCPRECGSHQIWLLFLKCFQSFTWSTFIFPYQKCLQSWSEELVTLQSCFLLPSWKLSPNTDVRDSYDKISSNFLTDLLKHFWMFIFSTKFDSIVSKDFQILWAPLAVLNLEEGRLFTLFHDSCQIWCSKRIFSKLPELEVEFVLPRMPNFSIFKHLA